MKALWGSGAGLTALVVFSLAACSVAPPGPAALDARHDACAFCRMAVSEPRFAAQLVAPGEEPRFFDDIGCLSQYLHANAQRLPRATRAYVADHASGAWVPAAQALYTRVPALATPMGSQVLAHADARSRARDGAARGGRPLDVTELFGPAGAPDGTGARGAR